MNRINTEQRFRKELKKLGYKIIYSPKSNREYIYKNEVSCWYIFCGCLCYEKSVPEGEKSSISIFFSESDIEKTEGKLILALKNKISSIIFQ